MTWYSAACHLKISRRWSRYIPSQNPLQGHGVVWSIFSTPYLYFLNYDEKDAHHQRFCASNWSSGDTLIEGAFASEATRERNFEEYIVLVVKTGFG